MTPCSESHQTCLVVRSTYGQTPCSRRVPRRRCASDTHRFSSAALGVYTVGGITSDSQLLCTAREQSKLPYLETGDWRLECQCNRQVLGLVAINSAAFCRYFARLLFSVVHLPLLEPRYNPHLARSTGIVKSGHGVAALATPTVHHVDVRKLVLDGDSELP